LSLGASALAQTTPAISPAPAFADEALTSLPRDGWLTNGDDYYNRRYSPLTSINRDNVGDLKAVWRTRLGGSGLGPRYSGEAQPIVYEGVVSIATGADDVAEVGKTGWVYILDRATGEPLHGIEETPVPQEPRQFTSPTRPIPIGEWIGPGSIDIPVEGFELAHEGQVYTPFWTEPVLPRSVGANRPPSAYDPRTQTLFVCGNDRTFFYSVDTDAADEPTSGTNYMAGSFGTAELPPFGLLTAMDMKTNTVVWQQRWASRCFSGIAATGSDLIFVGRNDGLLTALDSTNGSACGNFKPAPATGSSVPYRPRWRQPNQQSPLTRDRPLM